MPQKRYHVAPAEQATYSLPPGYESLSSGFQRWSAINGETGSHHQEFNICELEPGGELRAHIQTFEESVYVLEGEMIFETAEGKYKLTAGDYGVVHLGAAHAIRNEGGAKLRWAETLAPQPRLDREGDMYPTKAFNHEGPAIIVDPRDPRCRYFGNITPQHMDYTKQSQQLLARSASMRTALLVYSGITLKMMVDGDLGAYLHTTFMVQYEKAGLASTHDHPFEETYFIQEGEVDAWFDGDEYRLKPGDIALAATGCIHGFRNPEDRIVRWLETSAPQPPKRHAYRFARDWDYLEQNL